MTKKTTKVVDQRKTTEYYIEARDTMVKDISNAVVSKLAKGFMDYRNLVKLVNTKRMQAIEMAVQPVTIVNDDGNVVVNMYVDSIHYSRDGFVVRYNIEVDNRAVGSFSKWSDMGVYEFRERTFGPKKPTTFSALSWIIGNMFNEVEEQFNKAIFEAKLAPSAWSRYDDEE